MEVVKFNFASHGDSRGQLVAIEEMRDIPFAIRRVYYLFETAEGARRGFHAHKNLKQILVCVSGSCKVLMDNGVEKEVVELSDPSEGLYIANDIWREMFDFSPDAVLLVLASELYDESDYIRCYDDFLNYARERRNK